jgi:hypothetical protein
LAYFLVQISNYSRKLGILQNTKKNHITMKKVLLLTSLFACFTFGVFAGGPDEPVTETEAVETTTLTVSELIEIYGFDNVLVENGELSADAMVNFQTKKNPCGDPSFMPCNGALAMARAQAQQQANACCCVIVSGVECCDPSTGSLRAILFLVQPKGPTWN